MDGDLPAVVAETSPLHSLTLKKAKEVRTLALTPALNSYCKIAADMKPFISYHFFHGAGAIAPVDAYSKTKCAMNGFTDQKTPAHLAFTLELPDDESGLVESLFSQLCKELGPVSKIRKGVTLKEPHYRAHQWNLSETQLEEAFSLLRTLHRYMPVSAKRAYIQASWRFKFVEPGTATLLPEQVNLPTLDARFGTGSSFDLTTGKKTSANLCLLFPFETASEGFESYALRFQKELIFKLSPSHWRRWTLSPTGKWRAESFVPDWYK